MCGKVAVLLFFAATFCAEFLYTSAYNWKVFPDQVVKIVYPGTKSVTMTWKWSLQRNEKENEDEVINQLVINRYKAGDDKDKVNTIKWIGKYFGTVKRKKTDDDSLYSFNFQTGVVGGADGFAEFTIKDVQEQGTNQDGSKVEVNTGNYTYECELSVAFVANNPGSKSTTLIVNEKPSLTRKPENIVTSSTSSITLQCSAKGRPPPSITWDTKKASGLGNDKSTSSITLNPQSDAGVYTCTARNEAGSVSAVAVVQYTGCDSGCATDEGIAIEMTGLTYTSDYGNPSSEKYKKLKNAIEQECLRVYAAYTPNKQIYSCIVQKFRSGSVVALVKMTYPKTVQDHRKPLEEAIKDGRFANEAVKDTLVSPTKAPTESTQPTESTVASPSADGPNSGKRTDDGLSEGVIIAIVVVFSIIFIVIIVVIVVCMLKKKRPAPRKQYKEDGKIQPSAAAPLKSQPYKDPGYDNGRDDRYPNGGGPPPQYTAADYAEVRPSEPNRNDSQMEWDKDVDEKNEMWI